MNEKTELIGILGLGFLGKELAALTSWEEGSWGSWYSSPVPSCPWSSFISTGREFRAGPGFQKNLQ